jgi:hypothetical protein
VAGTLTFNDYSTGSVAIISPTLAFVGGSGCNGHRPRETLHAPLAVRLPDCQLLLASQQWYWRRILSEQVSGNSQSVWKWTGAAPVRHLRLGRPALSVSRYLDVFVLSGAVVACMRRWSKTAPSQSC